MKNYMKEWKRRHMEKEKALKLLEECKKLLARLEAQIKRGKHWIF